MNPSREIPGASSGRIYYAPDDTRFGSPSQEREVLERQRIRAMEAMRRTLHGTTRDGLPVVSSPANTTMSRNSQAYGHMRAPLPARSHQSQATFEDLLSVASAVSSQGASAGHHQGMRIGSSQPIRLPKASPPGRRGMLLTGRRRMMLPGASAPGRAPIPPRSPPIRIDRAQRVALEMQRRAIHAGAASPAPSAMKSDQASVQSPDSSNCAAEAKHRQDEEAQHRPIGGMVGSADGFHSTMVGNADQL